MTCFETPFRFFGCPLESMTWEKTGSNSYPGFGKRRGFPGIPLKIVKRIKYIFTGG